MSSRLAERPKPPSVDQIMSDIESSKDDDLVFTFGTPGVSRDSTPIASSDNSFDSSDKSEGSQDKFTELADRNASYVKVMQLLALDSSLKSSSDMLKDQYQQLQKLGVEVTEAIATLKSAAHTVNPKS